MRRQGLMRRRGQGNASSGNASSRYVVGGGPGTSPMCRLNASLALPSNVIPKLRVPWNNENNNNILKKYNNIMEDEMKNNYIKNNEIKIKL